MKKIIVLAAIALASCNNVEKETMTCRVKEVQRTQKSTLDFDQRYVIVTDCGWAASTKKRGLKVGDTVSFQVPASN